VIFSILVFVFIGLAIAADPLTTAAGTALDITALNVELSLYHTAVVAGTVVGPPVVFLFPVADSRHFPSVHNTGLDRLCVAYLLGPAFDHRNAAIDGHGI